jgi:two-component system, cell cycle response regulator DivK
MPDNTLAPLVLLVEDFVDAREMYRDYLEFSGFRVEIAGDGHEAVEKTRTHKPDLVLMDLSLPGLDGWEATRVLKSDPETAGVPILALSAHAMAPEGRRAHEAGCDGFISKPCLPHELVAEIGRFLALASPGDRASHRKGKRR